MVIFIFDKIFWECLHYHQHNIYIVEEEGEGTYLQGVLIKEIVRWVIDVGNTQWWYINP